MQILMGLIGMVALLAIAVLLSNNRKAINLRTVLGARIIQVGIGALILYVPAGRAALLAMSNGVASVIAYGNEGISFIFGGLVSDENVRGVWRRRLGLCPARAAGDRLLLVADCRAFTTRALCSWSFAFSAARCGAVLKTSRTESLSATAKHLCWPDRSAAGGASLYRHHDSLGAVCGHVRRPLASVAGSVLAGYAQMGVPLEYLIAASFYGGAGRPAVCQKLSYRKRKNRTITRLMTAKALTRINRPTCWMLPPPARRVWYATGAQRRRDAAGVYCADRPAERHTLRRRRLVSTIPELSLQMILGWIFSPLAWVIGVPWHEATVAGSFIGQKLIINEFVAYMNFGEYLKADAEVAAAGLQVISDHTKAIISFALCGFCPTCHRSPFSDWRTRGMSAQPAAGYRSAWATCGSGGDAVQPDERHHRRGFSRPVSLSPEPAATVPLVLL